MRVVPFDVHKAFDLIDHHVLTGKLSAYDIPRPIMCWIIDFLIDHKQQVNLDSDPLGVPQGIKFGPWVFVIMII